jgi:hypothetical protein
LAIAFQIACSAPAPMTIAKIGTVIWLWAIWPGYAASAA